ncbi:MAG: hypothetical protein JEZ08_24765 [Clostridiales bacterium]|nr:hypothetical protein [Clostridiales bacterium]
MILLTKIIVSEGNELLNYIEHMNSIDELYESHFKDMEIVKDESLLEKLKSEKETVLLKMNSWWVDIISKYQLEEYDRNNLSVDIIDLEIYSKIN